MNRILLLVIALVIPSCAWQSRVLQTGPDTYQVSANASPARGAGAGARKIAFKEANEFCREQGGYIEVLNETSEYAFPSNRVVTIYFRCKKPRSISGIPGPLGDFLKGNHSF